MANTKISEIANDVALGENYGTLYMTAAEASIKPGHWLYQFNASGFKKIEGANALTGVLGVAGVKYDHPSLDTAYDNGESGIPVITRGMVAAFQDDPTRTLYPGAETFPSGATAGSVAFYKEDQDWTALSGYRVTSELRKEVANGDTVGIHMIRR